MFKPLVGIFVVFGKAATQNLVCQLILDKELMQYTNQFNAIIVRIQIALISFYNKRFGNTRAHKSI